VVWEEGSNIFIISISIEKKGLSLSSPLKRKEGSSSTTTTDPGGSPLSRGMRLKRRRFHFSRRKLQTEGKEGEEFYGGGKVIIF